MTRFFCDCCAQEIKSADPIIQKIDTLRAAAQIRKPLMLCESCEGSLHELIAEFLKKRRPAEELELRP